MRALEPALFGIGVVTITAAGFLCGFVGFGNSILIVIIFSLLHGPVFAVPFAALASIPASIQLLPTTFRNAERRFVLPFAAAVLTATPFGALILVIVNPIFLKVVIAILVLAMVFLVYRNWRPPFPVTSKGLAAFGLGAGLAQGIAGAGGMVVAAVALLQTGTPAQQRANTVGGITVVALCNFPPFLYFGLFTREVVILSVIMIPAYLAGTWLGADQFKRREGQYYRNVALFVLAVIALVALFLSMIALISRAHP